MSVMNTAVSNITDRLEQALLAMRQVACNLGDILEAFPATDPHVLAVIEQQQKDLDVVTASECLEEDLAQAKDAVAFVNLYDYHENGEHPIHSLEKWVAAVGSKQTFRGYADWVRTQLEEDDS